MATDTTQTPWVWATTPDGRKVRVPRHQVDLDLGLTLAPSERDDKATEPADGAPANVREPARTTKTTKAEEATR